MGLFMAQLLQGKVPTTCQISSYIDVKLTTNGLNSEYLPIKLDVKRTEDIQSRRG